MSKPVESTFGQDWVQSWSPTSYTAANVIIGFFRACTFGVAELFVCPYIVYSRYKSTPPDNAATQKTTEAASGVITPLQELVLIQVFLRRNSIWMVCVGVLITMDIWS